MNDSRTWTTVWELTVGAGGGMGKGEKVGQLQQNNNKIFNIQHDFFKKTSPANIILNDKRLSVFP